jgi:hypothetical protein
MSLDRHSGAILVFKCNKVQRRTFRSLAPRSITSIRRCGDC